MKVALKYHRSVVPCELPDRHFQVAEPPAMVAADNLAEHLVAACDDPVESPSLAAFLTGKRRLLFVVSDATRKTGAECILDVLSKYFKQNNLTFEEIKIIIATGIHRPPTPDEVRRLVPAEAFPRAKIFVHDAEDADQLADFGRTPAGNTVRLNRTVAEADAIVLMGGIGFHYFAGFTGGRKSLLPGLAAKTTITFNHNLVFKPDGSGRHPGVGTAALKGNPVHEDMEAALQLVGVERVFAINALTTADGAVAQCVCGHAIASHQEACRRYLARHAIPLAKPADVVIVSAGGHPRDINLIQSHKAIEMARHALRPGGTMVVLAACPEGMGHPTFFPWFRFRSEREFREELVRNYVINGQTALALFEKTRRYHIHLISELPVEQAAATGLKPAASLSAALKEALHGQPEAYSGLVVPEGALTFFTDGARP